MDNLNQLKQIIGLKFDRVLFDNMSNKNLKLGVNLQKKIMKLRLLETLVLKQLNLLQKLGSTGFLLVV